MPCTRAMPCESEGIGHRSATPAPLQSDEQAIVQQHGAPAVTQPTVPVLQAVVLEGVHVVASSSPRVGNAPAVGPVELPIDAVARLEVLPHVKSALPAALLLLPVRALHTPLRFSVAFLLEL